MNTLRVQAHAKTKLASTVKFVPSRDGLRHAPGERSNVEDMVLRAEVMAEALCFLDEEVS